MKKQPMVFLLLLISFCLTVPIYADPPTKKPVVINNIQLGAKIDSKQAVGFTIFNMPWQPNPYTSSPNAYLVCQQGVFPAKPNEQEKDNIYTEDFWKSLTEWQKRWLTAQNIQFSNTQITTPNLMIACLPDNKIKIWAKPFRENVKPYRALLNSLSFQNQGDYPFIMSTPPENPSFYPPDKIPSELTAEFYQNAYGSLAFKINTTSGTASTLMIVVHNNEITAYQIRCAMHCRPVSDLGKDIEVYITQQGKTQWLMAEGKSQSLNFDPTKSFTLSIKTNNNNDDPAWQHLSISYQEGILIYWRNQNLKLE